MRSLRTAVRFPMGLAPLLFILGCLLVACADSPGNDLRVPEQGGGWTFYMGNALLEERIARADVIARVRLTSVEAGAEKWEPLSDVPDDGSTWYTGTLEHTFTVSEYLKGTGDSQIVAVVYDFNEGSTVKSEATQVGEWFRSNRNNQWDNRESIVFLDEQHKGLLDFPRDGYYVLGAISTLDGLVWGDHYSLASFHNKAWLPSAATGAQGASSASRSRGNDNTTNFLLDVPSAEVGGSGASAQSGQSGESGTDSEGDSAGTITLADMKAKIAAVEQEIAAGDGSAEYRECIIAKYEEQALVDAYTREDGSFFYKRYDSEIASGAPAKTWVHRAIVNSAASTADDAVHPDDVGDVVITGQDSELFAGRYPGVAYTLRPLPSGDYKFYYFGRPPNLIPCNGEPLKQVQRQEVFVAVTAPAGTVHEAFFDPVSSGDAVGYFGTGDALKPTTFSKGDTSTTIQSLKYDDSSVTLGLSPYNALAGHILDFITGDGTTALTFTADAATGDSTTGTLTWAVGSQPWSSGDELMLRIRKPNGPPVFGQDSYSFSVAQSASTFTIIGTVSATDEDGDTITYHTISGNEGGAFQIDLHEGFILVWKKLDYETNSSYDLVVEARDGNGRKDTTTVTIEVTDAAE